jgi:hypothetical protein
VISVRVKIDETAKMTGTSENGNDNIPFSPDSPTDKFFPAVWVAKFTGRHDRPSGHHRSGIWLLHFA